MNQPFVGTSVQSEDRSTDLRAKIVGILSDTANGCISELGYFPSLLRKFRELEQANNKWREENVRLFQDNRALAQYTRRQEEHIKTVATATPDNANRIAMLEEQVKTLSIQNAELRRMNEALVAVSSTNYHNPAHQQLLTDNQQFSSMHHTAIRTIHHHQQEVQPNAFHDNGKLPRSSHQNIALPGQDPRQHAPISQRVPHGYHPSHPPSMGTHQQIAGPTFFQQNASQPTTSPMPNLRMDYRSVSTATQMGAVIPNISRNVPSQTSPTSPVNSAHFPTALRRDSTQTRPPIVPNSNTQPYRLTAQTLGSSVPHRTSNSPQNPPLDNDQFLYDGMGWGGLLPNSPHSNRMPPSQSGPIPTPKSLPSQQVANQSPAARDIQHYSPTSSVLHELRSPPDSVSIQTPISSNQETLVVSSPWMAFDQIKREREDIGGDLLDTESAKKKIRLGEDDRVAEAAQVQDTSMDDESDQEIEVDSDGLRSIASCISELMENSMENPECHVCRLCDIRYKTGVISDAPKPLIGATQEQLVQHLTTEHADAWETLRRDV
ncbi:hypothetical protein JOM56_008754 [Amanita muscaria]